MGGGFRTSEGESGQGGGHTGKAHRQHRTLDIRRVQRWVCEHVGALEGDDSAGGSTWRGREAKEGRKVSVQLWT